VSRPLAKVRTVRRAHVVLDLDEHTATLLSVTAKHLHKSQSETVTDALRLLYVTIPRPDDAPCSACGGSGIVARGDKGQPVPPRPCRECRGGL